MSAPTASVGSWWTEDQPKLSVFENDQFVLHADTAKDPLFAHYNVFDTGPDAMIWRFTSRPNTETLFIKNDTPLKEVIKVIGDHSGGNDKKNENVACLSFCRNIGAFLGTAASAGGDKNVLNIINKAAYLCGIRISSLADKGISAHPALYRAISVCETEYVLLATRGDKKRWTLAELATTMVANPLNGRIGDDGTIFIDPPIKLALENAKAWAVTRASSTDVAVESVELEGSMPNDVFTRILRYAQAATVAANVDKTTIGEKEPIDKRFRGALVNKYLTAIGNPFAT